MTTHSATPPRNTPSLATAPQLDAEVERLVGQRHTELVSANRALESFASAIGRELRGPLRTIDYFSATLAGKSHHLDEEAVEAVTRIRATQRQMTAMVSSMLDYFSVSGDTLSCAAVDLSSMAQEVATDLATEEPTRRVEWIIRPGVIVYGDPHLLRIVLNNLLDNAFKFSRGAPEARIEFGGVRMPHDEIECYVLDNGAGFDMTYASKLFDAFERLHGSEQFAGAGIGLATVRRIVSRHGGSVRGFGTPGRGARLEFRLPGSASAARVRRSSP